MEDRKYKRHMKKYGVSGTPIIKVEKKGFGTGGKRNLRRVTAINLNPAPNGLLARDPLHRIGDAISDALDPSKASSKVRTLADMTEEEKAKLVASCQPPMTKVKKAQLR